MSSTAALAHVVTDHAVHDGATTAGAVYLYATAWRLSSGDHAPIGPVLLPAACAELSTAQRRATDAWLLRNWELAEPPARVLDAVNGVLGPAPTVPAEAVAHQHAAQRLAADTRLSYAAVVWAGVAAKARWLRLFGGNPTSLQAVFVDPIAAAAWEELPHEQQVAVATWVGERWPRIEQLVDSEVTG